MLANYKNEIILSEIVSHPHNTIYFVLSIRTLATYDSQQMDWLNGLSYAHKMNDQIIAITTKDVPESPFIAMQIFCNQLLSRRLL